MSEFELNGVPLVLIILSIVFATVAVVSFAVAFVHARKQERSDALAAMQQIEHQRLASEAARTPSVQAVTPTSALEAPAAAAAPASPDSDPAPEPSPVAAPRSFAPPSSRASTPPASAPPPSISEATDSTSSMPAPAEAPAEDVVDGEIDDRTHVAPRAKKAKAGKWTLVEQAGDASITVRDVVVVGRAPSASDHPGATVVGLDDPGRSISKTHAVLRADQDGLTIEDLRSTNGVHLLLGDGEEVAVEPGTRAPLEDGARVLIGEREFVVGRAR